MGRKPVTDSHGNVVGFTDGDMFVRSVDPAVDLYGNGYLLHDSVLDELVDRGIESIVLQEPARRLVSTIEDWQEFGRPVGSKTLLPISYMAVN